MYAYMHVCMWYICMYHFHMHISITLLHLQVTPHFIIAETALLLLYHMDHAKCSNPKLCVLRKLHVGISTTHCSAFGVGLKCALCSGDDPMKIWGTGMLVVGAC